MDLKPDQPKKFCINCKYFISQVKLEKIAGTAGGFTTPREDCSYAISPIDGTPRNTAAIFERSLAGHCGPGGLNYSAKTTYPIPFYNQR